MLTLGLHGICFHKSWGIAEPLSVCTLPFPGPNIQERPVPGWCWLLSPGFGAQRLAPECGAGQAGVTGFEDYSPSSPLVHSSLAALQ